jgi:hypothetical protein
MVAFADSEGYFATNPLTILGNGKNIQGISEDLICDVNGMSASLVFQGDTEGWMFYPYLDEGAGVSMPRGYDDGLQLSNNTGDADNAIDVSPGECRSDANDADLNLPNGITKYINASWSEGTGLGGMDTGSVAPSTWYHFWIIKRTDNGTVDALFSLSPTAPTMPASYDCKQRIMAVKTDGASDIIPFDQSGNRVTWTTQVTEINAAAAPGAPTLVALSGVPTGIPVQALVRMKATSATPGDDLTAYPATTTSSASIFLTCQVNGVAITSNEVPIPTDTSARIYHDSTGTVTESLFVNGWIDPRGTNQS